MNEPKPLPSETKLVERLRSWRAKLEAVGGYENSMTAIPADGVAKLIEDAEEAATALASLADELRLAREDARRYRWLRLHAKDRNVWQPVNAPELFDAAIDAAIKESR